MKNTTFDEFFRCMAYLGFNCNLLKLNIFYAEIGFAETCIFKKYLKLSEKNSIQPWQMNMSNCIVYVHYTHVHAMANVKKNCTHIQFFYNLFIKSSLNSVVIGNHLNFIIIKTTFNLIVVVVFPVLMGILWKTMFCGLQNRVPQQKKNAGLSIYSCDQFLVVI